VKAGKIDIIFANPFDTALLVRELGFKALAKTQGKPDEAVLVVDQGSSLESVEQLQDGCTIAMTNDPAISMIGMRLLEPADLTEDNTASDVVSSYVVVAKRVLNGDAQVGFLLQEAYEDMSSIIKSQLRVIVESQISVIYHSFLLGPKAQEFKDKLAAAILNMSTEDKGQQALDSLGFDGFEEMLEEDAEFMIDLMETLRD
jgi:phosphonate transport system substrate-binding protein